MIRMSTRVAAMLAIGAIAIGTSVAVAAARALDDDRATLPVVAAYYPLDEAEGAEFARDASGNGRAPLVQVRQENPLGEDEPVIFGSAFGSTTGARFAVSGDGRYLTAPVDYAVGSVEFSFRQDGIPLLEPVLFSVTGSTGSVGIWIDYNDGFLNITNDAGNGSFIATNVTDDEIHHVRWDLDGERLYLDDGEPLDLVGSLVAPTPTKISVGGMPNANDDLSWSQCEGSIAQVTIYAG